MSALGSAVYITPDRIDFDNEVLGYAFAKSHLLQVGCSHWARQHTALKGRNRLRQSPAGISVVQNQDWC
jgi:hypothetical protein